MGSTAGRGAVAGWTLLVLALAAAALLLAAGTAQAAALAPF